MRLRLFDRLWWLIRRGAGSRDAGRDKKRESRAGGHRKSAGIPPRGSAIQPPAGLPVYPAGRAGHGPRLNYPTGINEGSGGVPRDSGGVPSGRSGVPSYGGGAGRARIRDAPVGAGPFGSAPVEAVAVEREAPAQVGPAAVSRQPWYQVVGPPPAARPAAGQVRPLGAHGNPPPLAHEAPPAPARLSPRAGGNSLPFTAPRPQGHPGIGDGRTNCGPLEKILWRQWDASTPPPPQVIVAIERLAALPRALLERLADGLDGIYVGAGGVPQLDHMGALHGVPLPSGRATWDACAGAYGERKIVVGTRPSPTPDVVCHEVGHALDDLDSPPGRWQSDSAAFRAIYEQCQPFIASDFHRQRGGLGRKEFFADAFAAIASGQRPALVDMLNGNTRLALKVMLYFNRRYGI
jgi:hypothetical protein